MAQTITRIILPGEVVEYYRTSEYVRIAARITLGAGPCFIGVRSSLPPAGLAPSIRLIGIDFIDFVAGPGDTIYVGNTGALATTVGMIASPLPWPVEDDAGLVQAAEMVNYDAVPTLAVQPTPTRIYAASRYVEVGIGVRISTPGNGLWGFRTDLQGAYVQPAGVRLTKFIMSPGDQLYVAATPAAVTSDFQAVVSPCPWWKTALVRGGF